MSDKKQVQILSVHSDRVIKAAESCPTAKKILTELFPEAFLKPLVIPKPGEIWIHNNPNNAANEGKRLIISKEPASFYNFTGPLREEDVIMFIFMNNGYIAWDYIDTFQRNLYKIS